MSINKETENTLVDEDDKNALSVLLTSLLKGVIYQENDPKRWSQLISLHNRLKDYVTVLGLDLILDEAEGYAFLKSTDNEDDEQTIPRLITRRPLSFPVSLLLALLRKKLAEFDTNSGDTRLILSRDDIVELIRVFMPEGSNEVKLVDQIERHINKIIELGFLRKLNQSTASELPRYEVRRIIKAFVDAQWLAAMDAKLEQYKTKLTDK